jgi:hypothetical protein
MYQQGEGTEVKDGVICLPIKLLALKLICSWSSRAKALISQLQELLRALGPGT